MSHVLNTWAGERAFMTAMLLVVLELGLAVLDRLELAGETP
jgi:hypothetical protein